MTWKIAGFVPLGVAMVAMSVAQPAAHGSPEPSGGVAESASPAADVSHAWFNAVTATSPDDAWAVGWVYRVHGDDSDTLAMHWDGTAWTRTKTPSPVKTCALGGVSASSSSDAWAVGWCSAPKWTTLALHWDGTRWTRVPIHASSGHQDVSAWLGSALLAVAVASSDDAWAVGWTDKGQPADKIRTLTVHWDGTAWRTVASKNSHHGANHLTGVSVLPSGQPWSVGWAGFAQPKPVAERWRHSRWRLEPPETPGPGVYSSLSGVSADSSEQVWAVGYTFDGSHHTLIQMWDGSAWHQVDSPSPKDARLDGVTADSSADAWAVGSSADDHVLILHWDGAGWTRSAAADPAGATYSFLNGAFSLRATDAWAVGGYSDVDGHGHSLIEHWDGSSWTVS